MTELLTTIGILVALLFALAIIVLLMKRWYARTKVGVSDDELLTDFRGMVDAGELSPEEYQKVRAALTKANAAGKLIDKPVAKAQADSKPTKPRPSVSDEPV